MSKYPLDQNDMQEQYEDLLIKAALKEHARKESARLEQEAAGEAAVPPAEDNGSGYHYLCPFPCGEKAEHPGAGAVYHPLLHR